MTSAAHIAERLAGAKVRARGGNYLVPCPAHDDDSPSLSLSDGDRGLMVHCFAGCSAGEIYAAIRRKGHKLLEPGDTAPQPVKGSSEYERRQHEKAAWLWGQRKPIAGTVAERYLREVRHIACALPATLGFLAPLRREHHPALISAFAIVDEPEPGLVGTPKDVRSVHLTLLKSDGSGKIERTREQPDKLIIGSPLNRETRSSLPIVLAPPNDLMGMAISEGVEDGLTAHQGTELCAWAAGSASFMPTLAPNVPDYIEAVTIYGHSDNAGRAGAYDLARALERRGSGIEIRMEGLS